jgi:hypothetical protein
MISRSPEPARRTCVCGGSLRWEGRRSAAGERWIATCSNTECGTITTRRLDGSEPEVGLDHVLLDNPPSRYLSPWSRFYFRSTSLGYQRHPHHKGCWNCSGELVVTLDLPSRADRPDDPYQTVLCLSCGETVSFFRGRTEDTGIVVNGSAWDGFDVSISLLRKAISERIQSEPPDEPWSFE